MESTANVAQHSITQKLCDHDSGKLFDARQLLLTGEHEVGLA